MDRYEYKTVLISGKSSFGSKSINTPKMTDTLNKYGADGWELIASKASEEGWGVDMGILCIFKRCRTSKTGTVSRPQETQSLSQLSSFNAPSLDVAQLEKQNILLENQLRFLRAIQDTLGARDPRYGNHSIIEILEYIWEKMH
ncbi:MAG: DUF4177 domain-containing protein [Firmicutes bacterium]|nr:DUF4177 domain-containing protein [Bacillota bacterium]